MNYTNILVKGLFVCLLVLGVQMVFAVGADAGTITCSGGDCWYSACQTNSDCGNNRYSGAQTCQGNAVYQNYLRFTCNNPGTQQASCTSTLLPQHLTTCGTGQICQNGICQVGTNHGGGGTINPTCNQFAYKACVSNISYWYDSCGNVQSIAQNCGAAGQVCSGNGQCITATNPIVPPTPTPGYVRHSYKACYNKNVYWYDSRGYAQDLFQSCNDNNANTTDSCSAGKCVNTPTTATPTTPTTPTTPNQPTQTQTSLLVIASFAGPDGQDQVQKNLTANNGDKVHFLMTIKNTSSQPVDNVSLTVDAADNINFSNDVMIDGFATTGNPIAGISLGAVGPNTAKVVNASGTVQQTTAQPFQVVTRVSGANNVSDSDFIAVTTGSEGTGAVSESGNTNALWEFIKRWYLWIIILAVLVILFVIIFRRLSDNTTA